MSDLIHHAIVFVVAFVYSSYGEYILHRYIMHRPLFGFMYPVNAHAKVHHTLFSYDATYHCAKAEYKRKITMARWNALVIVPVGFMPFHPYTFYLYLESGWTALTIAGTYLVAGFMYYGIYEWIHWCMHNPKDRALERWPLFRKLNGHHLLHHRFPNSNFNVVLPLFDWAFKTLLQRSPVKFKQAQCAALPDVQPL